MRVNWERELLNGLESFARLILAFSKINFSKIDHQNYLNNMKNYFIKGSGLLIMLALLSSLNKHVFAGNEDRAGSAGATELLINPWARSAGWGGVNIAAVTGSESSFLNIAGSAFVKKTEFSFTQTKYLKG